MRKIVESLKRFHKNEKGIDIGKTARRNILFLMLVLFSFFPSQMGKSADTEGTLSSRINTNQLHNSLTNVWGIFKRFWSDKLPDLLKPYAEALIYSLKAAKAAPEQQNTQVHGLAELLDSLKDGALENLSFTAELRQKVYEQLPECRDDRTIQQAQEWLTRNPSVVGDVVFVKVEPKGSPALWAERYFGINEDVLLNELEKLDLNQGVVGEDSVWGFPTSAHSIVGFLHYTNIEKDSVNQKQASKELSQKYKWLLKAARKMRFSKDETTRKMGLMKKSWDNGSWVKSESRFRMRIVTAQLFQEIKSLLAVHGYNIQITSSDDGVHAGLGHYLGWELDTALSRVERVRVGGRDVLIMYPITEEESKTIEALIAGYLQTRFGASPQVINEYIKFTRFKKGKHMHFGFAGVVDAYVAAQQYPSERFAERQPSEQSPVKNLLHRRARSTLSSYSARNRNTGRS